MIEEIDLRSTESWKRLAKIIADTRYDIVITRVELRVTEGVLVVEYERLPPFAGIVTIETKFREDGSKKYEVELGG